MSNTCGLCNRTYVWPADLKRHLKSKHGQQKSTLKQQQPYTLTPEQQPYTFTPEQQQQQQQPYTFTPEQQPPPPAAAAAAAAHEQQPYSRSNEEEPYYILKTNNPYTFYVPDGYDSDHFMPWVHPFTSVISGPTGSGKSVFVRRFVDNIKHMMTPIPDRILWCYGEYQTLYGTLDGVYFQQGLPDLGTLDPREKHLIILDDLMDETDQIVASLFTKKSHHRNISVMYIVQNLFHRGKHHRTISLNAHYMVVFKNPRDVSQIMALAHQMYPQRTKYFLEAYTAATAQPHGYLVIDMKQETPDILRLRSRIFPAEEQKAYADI
jgi:hypothetical protein